MTNLVATVPRRFPTYPLPVSQGTWGTARGTADREQPYGAYDAEQGGEQGQAPQLRPDRAAGVRTLPRGVHRPGRPPVPSTVDLRLQGRRHRVAGRPPCRDPAEGLGSRHRRAEHRQEGRADLRGVRQAVAEHPQDRRASRYVRRRATTTSTCSRARSTRRSARRRSTRSPSRTSTTGTRRSRRVASRNERTPTACCARSSARRPRRGPSR